MRHTLIALLALACAAPAAADPSGWRVDNTGKFPKATPVTAWSTTNNVVWKTRMPDWSNATPVRVGDKLYLCAEPHSLLCVRLSDGKQLWNKATPDPEAAGKLRTHRANGYSSATPVTDGKHLWTVFGNGMTACYDLQGKRKWARKIGTPVHRWGHSASPVLVDDTVFVHIENTLSALDASTGKTRWTVASRLAWGSPAAATIGKTKVLALANGDLIGVKKGKKFATGLGRLVYGTPVIRDDILYFIDPRSKAIKLSEDGAGGIKTTEIWSRPEMSHRRSRFYASPVIHGNFIYTIEQRGTLVVLDARTGADVYRERLSLGRGTCYPSIVMAGKVVMAGSDNGTTICFRPGKQFVQVARNSLEMTRACAIFVGDRMIVRGYEYLYCIGKTAGSKPTAAPVEEKPMKLNPKKKYYE